jgi:hypothetical protein
LFSLILINARPEPEPPTTRDLRVVAYSIRSRSCALDLPPLSSLRLAHFYSWCLAHPRLHQWDSHQRTPTTFYQRFSSILTSTSTPSTSPLGFFPCINPPMRRVDFRSLPTARQADWHLELGRRRIIEPRFLLLQSIHWILGLVARSQGCVVYLSIPLPAFGPHEVQQVSVILDVLLDICDWFRAGALTTKRDQS